MSNKKKGFGFISGVMLFLFPGGVFVYLLCHLYEDTDSDWGYLEVELGLVAVKMTNSFIFLRQLKNKKHNWKAIFIILPPNKSPHKPRE